MAFGAGERSRAMRLSTREGVLWALMVGLGESYFVADAVRLGASALELGLVVCLPLFVGAAGSGLALLALQRGARRRPVTAAGALAQALVLGGILVLEATGNMAVPLLLAAVCLYQLCGQAAGTAWSSWYGDVVPAEGRGRYFAHRTRWITISTFTGLLAGGLLLEFLEPVAAGSAVSAATAGAGRGFLALYALALACRLASAGLIWRSPEPGFRGLADRKAALRFLGSRRGGSAWRLLLANAGFYLGVYLASPYFGPWMLEGLGFAYWQYMCALAAAVAAKALLLPWAGGRIDRHGPRVVLLFAAVGVALVPVPWLVAEGLALVLLAQLLSGSVWSSYEVSLFSLLLESTNSRARPWVFAAQNLLNGSAQLGGALLGALLLGPAGWAVPTLFGLSLGMRAIGVAGLAALVPPGGQGRRPRALRVVGMRPHGGLVHRPVDLAGESSPAD